MMPYIFVAASLASGIAAFVRGIEGDVFSALTLTGISFVFAMAADEAAR